MWPGMGAQIGSEHASQLSFARDYNHLATLLRLLSINVTRLVIVSSWDSTLRLQILGCIQYSRARRWSGGGQLECRIWNPDELWWE